MHTLELCRRLDLTLRPLASCPDILATEIHKIEFADKSIRGRWGRVFLERHIHTLNDLLVYCGRNGVGSLFDRGVSTGCLRVLCETLESFVSKRLQTR